MVEIKDAKELAEIIAADIQALEYLDNGETLEIDGNTGLSQEETKSIVLKHLKNVTILLVNRVMDLVHLNEEGDDKK